MALEEFTSGSYRDFRQRYLDVYGWYPLPSSELLVRVTEVGVDRMAFVDCNGISYSAFSDRGVKFKFIPITKKLFFHEGRLLLARRVPARQYQRGICSANTYMHTVSGVPVDVDFNTITSYVAAPNEAQLNDMLAIYEDTVWLYDQPIGGVTGNKLKITQKLFKQEVSDAVRDKKLSYEVV